MKLNHLVFDFDKFAQEMQNLKDKKHFDFLVTIVGEDFGEEEGLGCVYILENTENHERVSVKMLAKVVDGESVIPTVVNIWKGADLLERECFDFLGIKFLGHPDMRRLFLRNDFKGYPLRKDFKATDEYTLEDPTMAWSILSTATAVCRRRRTSSSLPTTTSSTSVLSTPLLTVCSVCRPY